MARYIIASPDEYLAITGAGVKTMKIVKSSWVWPFQRVREDAAMKDFIAILTKDSASVSAFNHMTTP